MPIQISHHIEQCLQRYRSRAAKNNRPLVTLCYAQSWDGSITIRPGESLALSNELSMRLTHRLRSLHDGILVGIGTVLSDDPQLTVRECEGLSPQSIVLDSKLRMPGSARLCQNLERKCWVVTDANQPNPAREDIDVIAVACLEDGHLDLRQTLDALWQRGIRSLMVEGGARVIQAFVKARLADAIVLTVAPALVGGYKAIDELGITKRAQLPRIEAINTQRLGEDLIMWGALHYGDDDDE